VVKVLLLRGQADEEIGEFELDHVPRVCEYVYVPSTTDPYGVRVFEVVEVNHLAMGVPADCKFGPGPRVVLRYSHEIE
jgi:hypothetical protein